MSQIQTIYLNFNLAYPLIFGSCFIGFCFGLINWIKVRFIKKKIANIDTTQKPPDTSNCLHKKTPIILMNKTSLYIQEGAKTFLFLECLYLSVFLLIFWIILFLIDKIKFYTAMAFIVGALTSLLSGFIGMTVATKTNVRVTYSAAYNYPNKELALSSAFNVAFTGGTVMGFCLISLALAILTILIIVYKTILNPQNIDDYLALFDYISGYGLGGSSVALFCRVGGGIYTKAADVGADLVGKNDLGLEEDSPDNPATIADNVGDNVGDIAGMGADLFGSYAEASCASLVISGTSNELIQGGNFLAPLVVTALGILACLVTTFFATHIMTVKTEEKIEVILKWQLIISSILLTPIIICCYLYFLPPNFSFSSNLGLKVYHNWGIVVCGLCGLWSGMIIGWFTDYFTSKAHSPVINLAIACKSGSAINIIHGLALGYLSCIIPITCLALTIYFSITLGGMYGISIAALGMISNLAICLTIDAYGPISDNAGGISEMSKLDKGIRDITDALDAAGNTTAAIGKGFAIGSACLVAIALFGAFVIRTKILKVNILEEIVISSIIFGAMIPYIFSAMTMRSVGDAAFEMCNQVTEQIRAGHNDPQACIRIATNSSLKEMILPGLMIIFLPIILGALFGPKSVTGYLAGIIVSGVQMAISSSNTGGAWDNAKKYVEGGNLAILETDHYKDDKAIKAGANVYPKRSKPHKAAVIGDTVGDPLKDTSGPSINILIKLSSIVSLVFGDFVVYTNAAGL